MTVDLDICREMSRSRGVRLAGNGRNDMEEKTNISQLAEHVWVEQHKIL